VATVRLDEFTNGVVIYFQTEAQRVNAYTLAHALENFADAARAANRSINPGFEIEIVVEALASGSFRTRMNAIYTGAGNLFTADALRAVILSVVASYVYEAIHPPTQPVNVIINDDEVIIERGKDRIVVPRNVYIATQEAKSNPQFTSSINQAVSTIASDPSIGGLGFVPSLASPPPELVITRDSLEAYLPQPTDEAPSTKIIIETCDLQIVKAILERTERKWEFRWMGVKVSAPVTDQAFYSSFFAHRIMIAPGDELQVRMKITQVKQPGSNIFTNVDYEVIEVLKHTPKVEQLQIGNQ
jgi:hypothetical protein